MKNTKELTKKTKIQTPASDKNKDFTKEENNLQNKRKDATNNDGKEKTTDSQDSKKGNAFLKK